MSAFNKVKMYYPTATHDKRISIAFECNALKYILFGLYFDAYSCMVGPTVHLACMQVHSAYIHLFMHCECIFLTTYEHIVKYFVCLHVECIMSTCKGMHSNPFACIHKLHFSACTQVHHNASQRIATHHNAAQRRTTHRNASQRNANRECDEYASAKNACPCAQMQPASAVVLQ